MECDEVWGLVGRDRCVSNAPPAVPRRVCSIVSGDGIAHGLQLGTRVGWTWRSWHMLDGQHENARVLCIQH